MTEITTFIDINTHVNQAITDYLDMPPAPRYALCVTGEWGSGKTYLLKRRMAELESSGRPVAYVSLNGVSNTNQIDDTLLDQFYPVLRNKKLKVASRLLTGVVKGFLKVDLEKAFDTDLKTVDGSVDISAPSSKLEEFLSKTNDSILFFDDIERSKISIEEVLGYVNYFVEHTGQKVILGCAKSQIADKSAYLEKKEKVIGISLPIKANAQQALNSFLDGLPPISKKMLNDNCQIILKIFKEAGYNNLRVLRQSCLRFDTIIKNFTQQHTENNTFISDLVGNYFPLALEIYGGKFIDDDLKKLANLNINYFEEVSLNVYHQKYSTLSNSSVGWTKHSISRIWIDFFILGAIDESHFVTVISAHQSFYNDYTPSWKRLWYWPQGNLSQVNFEKYLLDVLQKIDTKEYKTIVEVVHAWSIILGIQDEGFWPLNINKNYLVADGFNYIAERMQDSNFLSEDLIRSNFDGRDFWDSGLDGLSVHGAGKSKSQYFLSLTQAFNDGQKKLQVGYKISLKEEFLRVLKTDSYQLNNYFEKLQNSPYMPLFEELDFDILIEKFNTEDALIYKNLDYFIYRALKSRMIEKNNFIIKNNFIKLKTAISEKLCRAKESRHIIAVPIERLIKQIDKVLDIPLIDVESAKSL